MAAPAQPDPLTAPLQALISQPQGPHYAYTPPPLNYAGPYSQCTGPSQQGFAIAGFVLALCGGALLGLIFSWIAIARMDKYHNNEGRGLAKAGLIISIVEFGLLLGFCCLTGTMRR